MTDCLFCKIIEGEIPSEKVYEDDSLYAFEDIEPQAPVHILIIPKKHFKSLSHMNEEDEAVMGRALHLAAKLAEEKNLDNGYRVVINTGEEGGQSVDHCHVHLLGGRSLQWPPG